jgi:hypothetical protein
MICHTKNTQTRKEVNRVTAQYEWLDETGLGHPSLVYLDITGIPDELDQPFGKVLEQAPIIKVKQIDSFNDVFDDGLLNRRKVRVGGMQIVWYYREPYALFVAFERKEVK